MRAGLATDVLEEDLGARHILAKFRARLRYAGRLEMVKSPRHGPAERNRICPPKSWPYAHYMKLSTACTPVFGQIMVMRMFREKRILTQICGNNFMVLKAAPPLIVTDEQLDEFVRAIREVVELAETSSAFWTEALGMARRAVNI
jgi:ornithine--oxo-acid transaminase